MLRILLRFREAEHAEREGAAAGGGGGGGVGCSGGGGGNGDRGAGEGGGAGVAATEAAGEGVEAVRWRHWAVALASELPMRKVRVKVLEKAARFRAALSEGRHEAAKRVMMDLLAWSGQGLDLDESSGVDGLAVELESWQHAGGLS